MNGWIIALLILTGVSVYIGIAALFYLVLVKWCDAGADEDTASFALGWIATLPLVLLLLPFALFVHLKDMIDEEADNDNKR